MLEAYRGVAPDSILTELAILAEALQGRTLQHVSSTRSGGGVAELLARLVPLTESLGIRTTWDVILGNRSFFEVTKAMHNALQGADTEVSPSELQLYLQCLQENAQRQSFPAALIGGIADQVFHDPAAGLDLAAPSFSRRELRAL